MTEHEAILCVTFDHASTRPLNDAFEQLAMFAHGISQPPANRVNALMGLFQKKNYVSAEISARMFIEDFPEHAFGWAMLRDVLKATGREVEAQMLLNQEPVSAA